MWLELLVSIGRAEGIFLRSVDYIRRRDKLVISGVVVDVLINGMSFWFACHFSGYFDGEFYLIPSC